jgi:integrase
MGVRVREKDKGSGVYWIFVHHHGKRTSKQVGKDLKKAEDAAEKIKAKLTLSDFDIETRKKTVPIFKEYSELWLEGYVKQFLKPSTYDRYNHMLKKHVWPFCGSRTISEIKRGDVRQLLLGLSKRGLSHSTLSLARDVISGPLGQALDDEIIQSNPAIGVMGRLRIKKDKRKAQDPFDQTEVNLFLDTCQKNFPEWHTFYLTAFRTGMRIGEILGLKWGDIDFNGKFIHVQRSYKCRCISTPKNGKGRRVDMSDMLIASLRSHLVKRKREALQGGHELVEFIFHRGGQPIAQNSVRNTFKRILAKAGLRKIRFHDIRHTFATLLLSQGESPVYVKEQLGHHSIQMTVDVYGHLIPGANRGAVNKLDERTPNRTLYAPTENTKAATI